MSLESYRTTGGSAETIVSAEMAIFPWHERRKGLTGLFALFWLHVIATSPLDNPINRNLDEVYWDLWIVVDRKTEKQEKSGKSGKSARKPSSGKTKVKRYNQWIRVR